MDIRTSPPRYRIDDLEIDIGRAEVTRSGLIIALPKLSFDLLRALIHAAPGIATVDDLLQQVWLLPFADMSEKGDQQYLSDGMPEELIDMLTKIPELRVPARRRGVS